MKTPPKFELHIGSSGDYYYFQSEIIQRIKKKSGFEADFLYLLPVKRAVRGLNEQLIQATPNKVLPLPPINTFYQFMIAFYKQLPDAKKVVSPAMRLFLVEESLKKNSGDLRFFTTASTKRRGLIRKIDSMIVELRECGYDADTLLEQLGDAEKDDFRLFDFAQCIKTFEVLLGDRLIDEAGAIQAALDCLDADATIWQKLYPGITQIFISGYGLYSRPMIRFIEKMRHICAIKIKLDYLPESPQLFHHVEPAFDELSALDPVVIQNDLPKRWENYLFKRTAVNQSKVELSQDVIIQPTNHRRDEVAFIANYAKRLHQQKNIPLHKIGITFPSLELYAPLIHETFAQYGLPYNLSTGYQLSQSPLIRSFMLVLEIPLLGFELKKIQHLLSTPFFKFPKGEQINISALKSLAQDLRLTRFHSKWEEDVENYLAKLKNKLKETPELDVFEARIYQEKIKHYSKLIGQLKQFLSDFKSLAQRQTGKNFRSVFLENLSEYGFLDWYKSENQFMQPVEKEKEYRAFNRFNKLLDQFSWIVTNLHAEKKLPLKEFYQFLSLLVSQATYSLREWADYGVQIMPRLEVLSCEPEVLIFGGMIEGDFPRPFTHDVFFHDEERAELGLAATEDLLGQDRFLFYQILSSAAQKIVFTYPKFQKEAAKVPSNFLNTLADQSTAKWRPTVPSDAFLRSPQKLLEQNALKIPIQITANQLRSLQRWSHLYPKKGMIAQWLYRVRINHQKRRRNQFSDYEGLLGKHPQITQQLENRFKDAAFSVTRLEAYAFCPMQFYLRYLVGITEQENIEQGLTALERGQLVHNTLFHFYQSLNAQNRTHEPWKYAKELEKIATEEFEKLPFKGLLFELEQEKYFGTATQKGLWEIFLEAEQENITQMAFIPQYFEVAFGQAGSTATQDPISSSKPIIIKDGKIEVKLIGKIDRIDLNENGEALLVDYKTGNYFQKLGAIVEGLSLQLPVYAAALESVLKNTDHIKPHTVMAAIYQVKDPENCKRIPIMADGETNFAAKIPKSTILPNKNILDENEHSLTFLELLNRSEKFVFKYVQQIQEGHFRHTKHPEADACQSYCEFKRVCRKDLRKLLDA